jgi:hypothetical protein
MNAMEVANTIAMMHGHWGRNFDEVEVELYRQMLQPWNYDDAEVALQIWLDQENQYPPKPMELLKQIKRLAWGRAQEQARGAIFCDGSRWIEHPEGSKPCPNCNPVLCQVWLQPERWRQLRSGMGLESLHEGVRRIQGRLVADGPLPEACRLDTVHERDPRDEEGFSTRLIPSPPQTRAIARRAYISDCESRGVTPDLEFFDSLMEPSSKSFGDDGV